MIIELDINGARVIISGDRLQVSIVEDSPPTAPSVIDPKDIVALRKSKGWTQIDLASELGVTQGYISRLESGANQPERATKKLLERLIAEMKEGASAK